MFLITRPKHVAAMQVRATNLLTFPSYRHYPWDSLAEAPHHHLNVSQAFLSFSGHSNHHFRAPSPSSPGKSLLLTRLPLFWVPPATAHARVINIIFAACTKPLKFLHNLLTITPKLPILP